MDNKTNKNTIIIADDHPLFRSGVRTELENEKNIIIIAETGNGSEALKLINDLDPDVAILDVQMPGLSGIEIAEMLQKSNSSVKVILLTMHNEEKIFFKALNAGVKGYVLKDDAVLDIVNAVNTVTSGNEFVSDNLTHLLVNKIKNISAGDKTITLINELTPCEKKILSLVSELRTNEEISDTLFISKRTVENHKVNISKKLQLEGSRALLKFSIKYNDYLQ